MGVFKNQTTPDARVCRWCGRVRVIVNKAYACTECDQVISCTVDHETGEKDERVPVHNHTIPAFGYGPGKKGE